VLEQAVQFDEKELGEKCWNIVSEKTRECINSEAFCEIGSSTLNAFCICEADILLSQT
jgi:hypothetical protein